VSKNFAKAEGERGGGWVGFRVEGFCPYLLVSLLKGPGGTITFLE
jgi:hypothetical protein